MTTSEQYWIFSQEEPDLILRGNGKRFKPVQSRMAAQNESTKKLIEQYGEEGYQRMIASSLYSIAYLMFKTPGATSSVYSTQTDIKADSFFLATIDATSIFPICIICFRLML